jgi:hypothetical protein
MTRRVGAPTGAPPREGANIVDIPDVAQFERHHRTPHVKPVVQVQEWRVRMAETTGRRCTGCGMEIRCGQWYVRVVRADDSLEMYHYPHFWEEFGVAAS